jgi:hypothetical protein
MSLSEIASHAATSQDATVRHEAARAFFEQLWWYDQVVFDASVNL